MASTPRWLLALSSSLLALAGCQVALGFEDFEIAPGGSGGSGSTQESCTAGDLRCDGALLKICRAGGTGFDLRETCVSQPLCESGLPSLRACTPPLCGPGSRNPATDGELPKQRCLGGRVEVCTADGQQYVATECAETQCDPGGGRCLAIPIDAHEVTVEEYAAFQAAGPKGDVPDVCVGNVLAPNKTCLSELEPCVGTTCKKMPQTCVDWCDAFLYCQAKGQHLCGLVGDATKMVPRAAFDDPGQSEWMNICSAGGENAWVVGNEWDDDKQGQICNGHLAKRAPDTGSFFEAEASPKCASPTPGYKAILGLAGNAAEWENSCDRGPNDAEASKADNCRVRGGSSLIGEKNQVRCDADRSEKRSSAAPDIGFRCCGERK